MILSLLAEINYPSGSSATAFDSLIGDFATWINRIGGLVMFFGAVKFALALKDGDSKDKTLALLTFVAGAIIIDVSTNSASGHYLFNVPTEYNSTTATTHFNNLTAFVSSWTKKIGAFLGFVGATELALSIRNNDANAKVSAMYTLMTGGLIIAVAVLI